MTSKKCVLGIMDLHGQLLCETEAVVRQEILREWEWKSHYCMTRRTNGVNLQNEAAKLKWGFSS